MNSQDKKELKRIANEIKPQFNLGKEGVTKNFITLVDKYLNAHEIVKIKDLSSASRNDTIGKAQNLAKELKAEIIDKKGFTFVLYREDME